MEKDGLLNQEKNKRKDSFTVKDSEGNDIIMSQNQMAYMYNQYKDPANHPSFEQTYGEDYVRVMKDITNNLDPKVKEFADWQVNEFFRSFMNTITMFIKRFTELICLGISFMQEDFIEMVLKQSR